MKQPHTETSIKHSDDQQNTGNHKKPQANDAGGADRFGGTRSGAANVEKTQSVENGPDVSRVPGLDDTGPGNKAAPGKTDAVEQAPERDERGRL